MAAPLVCLPARALASKQASLIASSLLWIRKHWKEIWTENSMKNKHSELCAQRKWQKLNCSHKNKHELDFLYSVQHKATVFHQISFVYLVYKWMFVNEKSLLSPFCSSLHTHTLNWNNNKSCRFAFGSFLFIAILPLKTEIQFSAKQFSKAAERGWGDWFFQFTSCRALHGRALQMENESEES